MSSPLFGAIHAEEVHRQLLLDEHPFAFPLARLVCIPPFDGEWIIDIGFAQTPESGPYRVRYAEASQPISQELIQKSFGTPAEGEPLGVLRGETPISRRLAHRIKEVWARALERTMVLGGTLPFEDATTCEVLAAGRQGRIAGCFVVGDHLEIPRVFLDLAEHLKTVALSDVQTRDSALQQLEASLEAFEDAQSRTSDEGVIRRIKTELWPKAYRNQDVELLDRILHDSFQMIDAEGNRSTKAQEIEYVTKNQWDPGEFEYRIDRLDVYNGTLALVDGVGIASDYSYSSSNVLIKENGEWRAISSHVSGFKPKDGGEGE